MTTILSRVSLTMLTAIQLPATLLGPGVKQLSKRVASLVLATVKVQMYLVRETPTLRPLQPEPQTTL